MRRNSSLALPISYKEANEAWNFRARHRISPPKNPKRAELVLDLPRRDTRIQVPNVDAGHELTPARAKQSEQKKTLKSTPRQSRTSKLHRGNLGRNREENRGALA